MGLAHLTRAPKKLVRRGTVAAYRISQDIPYRGGDADGPLQGIGPWTSPSVATVRAGPGAPEVGVEVPALSTTSPSTSTVCNPKKNKYSVQGLYKNKFMWLTFVSDLTFASDQLV
jgi:hypothetical protein